MAVDSPNLRDLSDREIMQLLINTLVHVEERVKRIEQFLDEKHGAEFSGFSPNSASGNAFRKTILEYHDDALALMESN